MDRDFYEEHRGARCPDRLFSKDARKIKQSIDSAMDASYYGNWADPARLVLFSYIEGDCLTTQCDTAEEFTAEIVKVCDWLRLNSTLYGIDPGLKATAKKPWEDLGLSDLLH